MRRRLAQAAVFVCFFAIVLGYCEWWQRRSEEADGVNPHSPPDHGAFYVSDAGDETYDGLYMPASTWADSPCYVKLEPERYMWRSPDGWCLSSKPGSADNGYTCEGEAPVGAEWVAAGASDPAPTVGMLPEIPGDHIHGGAETTAASPPGSY